MEDNKATLLPIDYETLKESHFRIKVEGENILKELVEVNSLFKLDKPKLNQYCGKEWNPINLYFKDFIGPSTSQRLIEAWQDDLLNGVKFFINGLDPTNEIVQKWEIIIKKILEIDFGGLDVYSNKESIVKVTIEIEEAILRF